MKFKKCLTYNFWEFALVEQELNRLEHEDILNKVMHSKRTATIIAVPKRMITLGLFIRVLMSKSSLPPPSLPLTCLLHWQKERTFLSWNFPRHPNRYHLKKSAAQYLTIITHMGMYKYTASAPGIFPRAMVEIL